MLDEKRIKEAERNVKHYLEERLLWKLPIVQKEVLSAFQRNYLESLDVAQKLLDQKLSNLWVIVTSYYAMYTKSANYSNILFALLYI